MKRFFRTLSFAALLFFLSFVFLALPLAFFLPYEKEDFLRSYFLKDKMLVEHTSPTVFLLGGSNVAFGFDSEQLEKAVHIPVVNMGLHAGFGPKFTIDHTIPYLKTGDVLILSFEYGHLFSREIYGGEALADIFYLSKGKILPYLGMEQVSVILEKTPYAVIRRIGKLVSGQTDASSGYGVSSFNKHGDVCGHREMPSKPFAHIQPLGEMPDKTFLDYLCQQVEELRQRGVIVFLFPPVLAETSFVNIQHDLPPLVQALKERNIPFALPPEDFAFPDSLFFDTPYHLGYQGTLLRTQKVIDRLTTLQVF